MGFEVRLALEEEVSQISQIAGEILDSGWTEDAIGIDFKDNEASTYVVAISDDADVLGFASAWTAEGSSDIMQVAVLKQARRQGIGRMLVEKLMQECQAEHGSQEFILEVKENNIGAIKLYENCDFEAIGRRKRYYNNGADALIMRRRILV